MTIPEHAYIGSVGYLYSVYSRFCPVAQTATLEQLRAEVALSRKSLPEKYLRISADQNLFHLLMSLIRLWSVPMEEHIRLADETAPPSERLAKLNQEIKEALEDELYD